MRTRFAALVLCLTLLPLSATTARPSRPRQRAVKVTERIKKVVFYADLLWVLGLDGTLLTLDPRTKQLAANSPDKLTFDVYLSPDKRFYLLTGASPDAPAVRVWQRTETSWRELAVLKHKPREPVLGLREYHRQLLVLTGENVYLQQADGSWRVVALKEPLGGSSQSPFAVTDDGFIYLGLNRGEWGGGLLRIGLEGGQVKSVERRDSADLCAGPLNADCDPVTGVIRDPAQPDCALVSVGLRHFRETGRLLRVCQARVSLVFSKPYKADTAARTTPPPKATAPEDVVWDSTEAIFDLILAGQSYWAVTGRGIYHFTPDKPEEFYPLPQLKNVAGVYLSDVVPGVVVVSTDINWAHSVSGYTPLLAVKN